MDTIETISLQSKALNAALGGGIKFVQRTMERHCATVLIRGPAGVGKSLFAQMLAHQIASAKKGDVLFATVETPAWEPFSQRRMFTAWNEQPAQLYAGGGFIPVGAAEGPMFHFYDAMDTRKQPIGDLDRIIGDGFELTKDHRHGPVRVCVVDGLCTFLSSGETVERQEAEAVAAIAIEHELVLILCEEAEKKQTSPWPYVMDTVIELDEDQYLRVTKHRFGAHQRAPVPFCFTPQRGLTVGPDES